MTSDTLIVITTITSSDFQLEVNTIELRCGDVTNILTMNLRNMIHGETQEEYIN